VRHLCEADHCLLLLEERQTGPQPVSFEQNGLTRREAEVLQWVTQGKTNTEIGCILGISTRTTQKHLEHIYEKLGVETRTAAATLALGWRARGRPTSTVALYRITKRNILATDPTNPLARLPLNEARSRGIDLDLSVQLTDHWSVIGSYAYTDTRIVEDRFGLQGHRLPNVSLHSGSLWIPAFAGMTNSRQAAGNEPPVDSNCLTADRLSSNIKFNVRLPLLESPARALPH